MTRCPVTVFAEPYRPRKSTAASSRAFGDAAKVGTGFLLIIVILTVVYIIASAACQ